MHCPTGKPETDHIPALPMTMKLYGRLVGELARRGVDNFGFGLFGDGLLDPFISERVALTRLVLPDVQVTVNTNGAAYNRIKHKALAADLNSIIVHVESLKPDLYAEIMAPLRLERVLPKVDMILEDFGPKTILGLPLHKLNIDERDELVDYFMARGAGGVFLSPTSNRASVQTRFDDIAFLPMKGFCRSDILRNLMIDYTGLVLLCCNDFKRQEPIGDPRLQSLDEILQDHRRLEMGRKLDAGEWGGISTCSMCKWDGVEMSVLDPEPLMKPWRERRAAVA